MQNNNTTSNDARFSYNIDRQPARDIIMFYYYYYYCTVAFVYIVVVVVHRYTHYLLYCCARHNFYGAIRTRKHKSVNSAVTCVIGIRNVVGDILYYKLCGRVLQVRMDRRVGKWVDGYQCIIYYVGRLRRYTFNIYIYIIYEHKI